MSKMICKCTEQKESFSGKNKEEPIRWGPIVFKETVGNITLKVQKQIDWDDWVVRWFENGKEDEPKSYHAYNDKENAIEQARYDIEKLKNRNAKDFSGLENKYFKSYSEALDYIDNQIDFEKEYPNSMATIKMILYGQHAGKYQIFDYPKSAKNPFSGRIVNEDLAKTSPCNKIESTRFFKKGIAGQLNKDQIENYCFEKD